MSLEGSLTGGIIAAGDGRRLRGDGWSVPKPLVPVAGVPLLEVVVRNFLASAITPISIIVNERDGECVAWARTRLPGADLRFIVKTTASSLESFTRVAAAGLPGSMLISTVDAWCRPDDFARFVAAARRRPPDGGGSRHHPTRGRREPPVGDGRSRRAREARGGTGGRRRHRGPLSPAGGAAPAGATGAAGSPARVPRVAGGAGEPMYAETIDTVVDVDRASDVALAESLAHAERSA